MKLEAFKKSSGLLLESKTFLNRSIEAREAKSTVQSLELGRGGQFMVKLEKHIRDNNSGRGYLSRELYGALKKRSSENITALNQSDYRSGALYSAYMSAGFNYGSKARFISSVSEQEKSFQGLRQAIEIKKEYDARQELKAQEVIPVPIVELEPGSIIDEEA